MLTSDPTAGRKRVCAHFLPDTDAAGAENQALSLIEGLIRQDSLDLELAYLEPGRNHERFRRLGIPLHRLERRRRFALDFPRRVRALRGVYRGEPPALLHTWLFEANTIGLWAARRWPQTRVVISQRSGTMERAMPGHMRAIRAVIGRADHAIANSAEGAELLVDLGLDETRLTVVGQGVASERLAVGRGASEVREELGVAPGAPLLVTVGRADATKDLGGLFEALARVRAVRPDASLALVGADPEDLGSLDLELPPGVAAIGWQDRPADYLAAADAVVIPSWTEGHSNVADEALMLGRPVVTTDAGAHPPIVREAGGRVVPIRRPDALGEAILDVLASPPSSDAVRSVAERCLGMDGVLDATMAVYERVLGS